MFLENLVFYICVGYMPLSSCKNIWLHKLVLHQLPCIVFPFHSSLVEKFLPRMVTKTMNLRMLLDLAFVIFFVVLTFGCLKAG
jgi:hypothetical protein